jgi:hypothetical protein
MENISSLFLILVFGLGSVVGGLVVTLQRQCAMERIRQEFEQELVASVGRHAGYPAELEAVRTAQAAQGKMVDDFAESADEVDSWEGTFIPATGEPRHTHAGV